MPFYLIHYYDCFSSLSRSAAFVFYSAKNKVIFNKHLIGATGVLRDCYEDGILAKKCGRCVLLFSDYFIFDFAIAIVLSALQG